VFLLHAPSRQLPITGHWLSFCTWHRRLAMLSYTTFLIDVLLVTDHWQGQMSVKVASTTQACRCTFVDALLFTSPTSSTTPLPFNPKNVGFFEAFFQPWDKLDWWLLHNRSDTDNRFSARTEPNHFTAYSHSLSSSHHIVLPYNKSTTNRSNGVCAKSRESFSVVKSEYDHLCWCAWAYSRLIVRFYTVVI